MSTASFRKKSAVNIKTIIAIANKVRQKSTLRKNWNDRSKLSASNDMIERLE